MEGVLHSLGSKEAQQAALDKLAPIRMVLDQGAREAAVLRDANAFRWVDLGSMFERLQATR